MIWTINQAYICELLNCHHLLKIQYFKLKIKQGVLEINTSKLTIKQGVLTIKQGVLASDSLSEETKRSMRKKHMMERLRENVSIMFTCTCSTFLCFLNHTFIWLKLSLHGQDILNNRMIIGCFLAAI